MQVFLQFRFGVSQGLGRTRAAERPWERGCAYTGPERLTRAKKVEYESVEHRKLSEFGNGNKSEEVNRNVYFLFRCQIARFPGLKSFIKVHSRYIFDKFRLWFVEETIYLTHNFEINLIVTHFAVYYIV